MTSSDQISSLLNSLLSAGKGSIPLSISLKEDEEVQMLRQQVSALEEQLNAKQVELDRTEYLFKCESILNNKLVDLIRDNGISLGSDFFKRPY